MVAWTPTRLPPPVPNGSRLSYCAMYCKFCFCFWVSLMYSILTTYLQLLQVPPLKWSVSSAKDTSFYLTFTTASLQNRHVHSCALETDADVVSWRTATSSRQPFCPTSLVRSHHFQVGGITSLCDAMWPRALQCHRMPLHQQNVISIKNCLKLLIFPWNAWKHVSRGNSRKIKALRPSRL